jgi:hypothetical protein
MFLTAALLVPNGAFVHPFTSVRGVKVPLADERAFGPTHPVQLSAFPAATPRGPFENTPYFVPVPWTPTPSVPDALPVTPYRATAFVPVADPWTPFAFATVAEFVAVTAGVPLELVKVPTTAIAAVGIATTATIATHTIVAS